MRGDGFRARGARENRSGVEGAHRSNPAGPLPLAARAEFGAGRVRFRRPFSLYLIWGATRAPAAAGRDFSVTRTLVIDDEPAVRGLLRAILTANGHEVFEAPEGAEALRLLEGRPVELVF